MKNLIAQSVIENPVLSKELGNHPNNARSGTILFNYALHLWRVAMSVGALLVIAFFIWGAFEWMLSGNDPKGADEARKRMTNATIGLIILVSSYAIIGFVSWLFFKDHFSILEIYIPTAL